MADHTHTTYPIVGNTPGKIVQTEMALPVDASGSTLGRGMHPQPGYPRIPAAVFGYKGRGRFDLDEPNVTPLDVRFTRGPRLNGRQGTLDIWMVTPDNGTARTLCYLTDNVDNPTNVVAIRITTNSRFLITVTDVLGTIVAEYTEPGAVLDEGLTRHIRMAWDSDNLVDSVRHAGLSINGEAVTGTWSTDPTAPWGHFVPTHIVLGQGFGGDSDVTDASMLKLVQGSMAITL